MSTSGSRIKIDAAISTGQRAFERGIAVTGFGGR
jgi:hypothetical protein